jgi:hypothetical protein
MDGVRRVAAAVGERVVTAVLPAPVASGRLAPPPVTRRRRVLVAVLVLGAVALLVLAGLRAAAGATRFETGSPAFAGTAPAVTLPTYGRQGMYVVGYEHGATVRLTLPIRNAGLLPVTVTSVALGGGAAPLLQTRAVAGLPLSLGPGQTGRLEVTAELGNCKFFHEREVQNYPGVDLGFSLLGQAGTLSVAFDRPILVHSPMIVDCPDRLLDREANDRSDLTNAA